MVEICRRTVIPVADIDAFLTCCESSLTWTPTALCCIGFAASIRIEEPEVSS
jgi:hypothetical protein